MSHPDRGRPRDPEVDSRIMAAAVEEYAVRGWEGFALDRVARTASVGKGSIYLRWRNKTELLMAALEHELLFVPDGHDRDSLEDDLRALANQLAVADSGLRGRAFFRALVDLAAESNLVAYTSLRQAQLANGRAIVRRAQQRGEVPLSLPVTLPLEAIAGSILMHLLWEPRISSREESDRFVTNLVCLVMRSVTDASREWAHAPDAVA